MMNDLQTDPSLCAFARNPDIDQTILLTGRRPDPLRITLHRMEENSLDTLLAFQTSVISGIPDNAETNLFESLSREEFDHSLKQDLVIGVFHDGRLVGLLVLLPCPTDEQNLLLDLAEYRSADPAEVLVVDAVLVAPECRGYGMQRMFFRLADAVSAVRGLRYECCVVSPLNSHSLNNALQSGFRRIGTFKKYHSTRSFFVKERN